MRNVLMVVSGPSGVGKGTLVKTLLKRRADVVESVSCTTRAPREGEVNGREYFFLSKEEFSRRIAEGDFLEYDEHFGNYYGTPKSFVKETLKTKSVIMEIDVVGGFLAKKAFPECILIFVAPPSVEELKRRLLGRKTETEEEVLGRLSRLEYEMKESEKYDYVLINDDFEKALEEFSDLIDREKEK
ncbi:MAG: guanylate kinase [Clostridia bacterium]|nr:guanylate kinase [Clostridia bacterium]